MKHNTTHIRVILVLQNEGPGLLKKACIVWRSADKIRDVTVARTVSSAHRQGLGGTGGRSKGKEKGRGDGSMLTDTKHIGIEHTILSVRYCIIGIEHNIILLDTVCVYIYLIHVAGKQF